MAFVIPEFPLDVEVWSGPWLTKSFRFATVGNLALGLRAYTVPINWVPAVDPIACQIPLLLPKLTDVRDRSCGTGSGDVLEIPIGSGRWYGVIQVDDVGKGFANEHRVALIGKIYDALAPTIFTGLNWPTPIP